MTTNVSGSRKVQLHFAETKQGDKGMGPTRQGERFTFVFMSCIHLFSGDPPSHNQDDDHYNTH